MAEYFSEHGISNALVQFQAELGKDSALIMIHACTHLLFRVVVHLAAFLI